MSENHTESALGARLRAARESRRLTVEAAGREAGVPLRYLRMLEEGRFPTVADPAYLTHFLRRYAKFLGLDAEASARDFLNETEPETTARRTGRATEAGAPGLRARAPRRAALPGWVAYAAVLVAGLAGLLTFVRMQQEREAVTRATELASRPLGPADAPGTTSRGGAAAAPGGAAAKTGGASGSAATSPAVPAPAKDASPVRPAPAGAPDAGEGVRPPARDRAEKPVEPAAKPENPGTLPVARAGQPEAAPARAGENVAKAAPGARPAAAPSVSAAEPATAPPAAATADAPAATAPPPAARADAPAATAQAPAARAAAAVPSAPQAAVAARPSPAAAPRADEPRPPFELRVTATSRQVWIWVSVDGGPQQAVSLEEGESAVFRADRRYVMSIDDAGGIVASLNGRELPSFGASAQVRRNVVIPSAEFGGRAASSRG